MNKLSISHGQSAVPMNLFATWEVDRSSPHSVPRVCSLALGKLIIIKELDRDVQSVFLAVKMQGSKRVLRSNEIGLPNSGSLNADLELTFSLQYPHFIKRDGNNLQIMLQRKKRYKNRAMLGYKTLAMGNLDLAQIIQSPITEESSLDLLSANKDRTTTTAISAQVVISSAHSTPADEGEAGFERMGKQIEADRSPDLENYTDDEETYSSDPELGSDVNTRELYMDEDDPRKRKERRKHRLSSSSRQQNFIKAKLIALLRKFKQENEDLEPDIGRDPGASVPVQEDLDFLYQEIEDLNLSDSCPEVEDNISIVSTPKPKLRPFFDRVSHSSSQTEICSLRDQYSSEYVPYYSPNSRENTLRKYPEARETFDSLRTSDKIPAIDQSDSSDQEENQFEIDPLADSGGIPIGSQPGSPMDASLPLSVSTTERYFPRPHSPAHFIHEGKSIDRTSSAEELDLTTPYHQTALHILHGTFSLEEDEAEVSQTSLTCPLILINSSERNGRSLAESFQSYLSLGNPIDAVVLATSTPDQLNSVFGTLLARLQKFINSNSQQPMRVRVVIAGTESYTNHILQQFVDFLSSRSPEWMTYFLFLIVPLGKNRLGNYLSSIDGHYSKLFADQTWREMMDKPSMSSKSITPTSSSLLSEHQAVYSSFDNQFNMERLLVHRIFEYINQASSTFLLSIAEAMLTFGQKSDNEDSSQKFVPFISEAKVGANEFLMQTDSDKEDFLLPSHSAATSGTGLAPCPVMPLSITAASPASAPTGTAVPHASLSAAVEPKMGLQVDYWKDKDFTKYTLKTTFRSFLVSKLPANGERIPATGLSLDVVTIGKKNIMRLPGKKGKEKEADSKSLVISSVNRIICASKHQHSLLKVKIDGIEWNEVKFFQLSSHWSSHVKIFPVGLFPAH